MIQRLAEIFSSKTYEFPALLNAIAAWLWGVWLLLPFHTFANSHSLDFMASLAPESIWGIMFATVGGLSIFAILEEDEKWNRLGAVGTFYVWLVISISVVGSNWTHPGTGLYPILALFSAWIYAQSRD